MSNTSAVISHTHNIKDMMMPRKGYGITPRERAHVCLRLTQYEFSFHTNNFLSGQ